MHASATETAHREAYQRSLAKRSLKAWLYVGPRVPAFVNDGRLIIRCPNCDGGVAVSMAWQSALCRGCGAEFTGQTLTLPSADQFADLADVLAVRPERRRHWLPTERVTDLERENTQHGLPTRASRKGRT